MIASDLFELPESLSAFSDYFLATHSPWAWLPKIKEALAAHDFSQAEKDRPEHGHGVHIRGDVYLHPTVKLPPTCFIEGPCYIGPETEIRPGAFIRGNVIIGKGCVVGNACEYKNCLLMDNVQTPHYNYVGDSILGNGAHLGAGVICANLRLDQKPVSVITPDGLIDTELRKLGAILGDGAEAGCNAVLQPGTILDKRAAVGPTLAFGGYLEPGTIAFSKPDIRRLPRRD